MKAFTRILLVSLAALALVFSLTGAAAGADQIFTVYPTGVDDTDNLIQAFEQAKSAGPGSTVLLAPGHFITRLIEVQDFDGYFKGSGQEATIIDTFENQDCAGWLAAGHTDALFSFVHGYARVSDLTIHLTPPTPCTDGVVHGISFSISRWNPDTDCSVQLTEPLNGSLERVTLWGDNNIGHGILYGGAASYDYWDCPYNLKFAEGEFTVRRSTIRGILWAAIAPFGTMNSQITIGGSSSEANTIDGALVAVWPNDHSGTALEIAYNDIDHVASAVSSAQGSGWWYPYLLSASAYNIHHNRITAYDDGNAISLFDFDNYDNWYPRIGQRIIANIHHNHITLASEDAWGILPLWVDDAQVHQNTIDGASSWAMVFGLYGTSRGGWIVGNDLHNYVSSNAPYKILLTEGTQGYRVTTDEPGSVLDEGTDNWINERLHQGRQAQDQTIAAMMERKMEALMARIPASFRNRFELLMPKP